MSSRSRFSVCDPGRPACPEGAACGPPHRSALHAWWARALLLAAGVLIYANSFSAPWVFDGHHLIEENRAIRQWWPPWLPMRGTTRPATMFSFAVNYAVGGPNAWGYHAVNLAIHVAAAVVLFEIVRRVLAGPRLASQYAEAAPGLALAVALLWLVHPLQTQSVTYLYQRFESLMGLFFLLTFYTFLRAIDADRPLLWYAASVACWFAGLGSKETAVAAPFVLLWYDRALVAESWGRLWRRRGPLYLVFAAVLGAIAWYGYAQQASYARAGVMDANRVSIAQYALSQPGVIVHYLRLCFWPQGQCLDYAWPVARTSAEIVPPLIAVGSLIAATAWCVVFRPAWGFLGGTFFLTLAPTSSFVPIVDLAFEHRMYLPLAAVTAAAVFAVYELGRRSAPSKTMSGERRRRLAAAAVIVAVLLGIATVARNEVYRDEIALWSDVVEKAPHNARAHVYLGNALRARRPDLAARHYKIATEFQPLLAEAHNNLANLLQKTRPDLAMEHYLVALRIDSQNAEAHNNLANLLARQGRYDQAIEHYRLAMQLRSDYAQAEANLQVVLQMQRAHAVAASLGDGGAGAQAQEHDRGSQKKGGDPH